MGIRFSTVELFPNINAAFSAGCKLDRQSCATIAQSDTARRSDSPSGSQTQVAICECGREPGLCLKIEDYDLCPDIEDHCPDDADEDPFYWGMIDNVIKFNPAATS